MSGMQVFLDVLGWFAFALCLLALTPRPSIHAARDWLIVALLAWLASVVRGGWDGSKFGSASASQP